MTYEQMTLKPGQKIKISFCEASGAVRLAVVYSCDAIVVIDDDGDLAAQSENRLDKLKHIDKIEIIR